MDNCIICEIVNNPPKFSILLNERTQSSSWSPFTSSALSSIWGWQVLENNNIVPNFLNKIFEK